MLSTKRETLWGLKIFGWGLIVTSLIHMHKMIFEYNFYINIYTYLGPLVYLRYAFSWFQRIAGILIGVGLLKEKKWAPISGIILGSFTILTIYWKHPYTAFHNHTQLLDKKFGHLLQSWNIPSNLTFESATVPSMIVHCLLDVSFWAVFIFYVTRPAIRERFR